MKYSKDEVIQYIMEDDVKFIRLAFCDVYGKQKNISIMPEELERAFKYGIAFDASAIKGFGDERNSDLLLHPDPSTLTLLPWRPEHGKVVRMFSSITYPSGKPFECDSRNILKKAIGDASEKGYCFTFGTEQEFYLFNLDENDNITKIPYDNAGYMDIAPEDKGENIRRDICLTLEQMGIRPESSHHEEGPGQNEIDFRYSDALNAADNSLTFQTVVKTVARANGLHVDFSPKPLEDKPGNSFHINISLKPNDNTRDLHFMIAGILDKIPELTAFLNPSVDSYKRFGKNKAPGYISWSHEDRSQLIRIPAANSKYRRAELRSPDSMANPYIAFALLIYASLYGLENRLELQKESEVNLYNADSETLSRYKALPSSLEQAKEIALNSDFIKEHLPKKIIDIYCR